MLQQCGKDCVIIGGSSTPFKILGCDIDLIYGTQYKCNYKSWFLFYNFLWTCQETEYLRLSCENFWWLTIAKYWAFKIFCRTHSRAVEWMVGEGKVVSWGGALTKGEVRKWKLTKKYSFAVNFWNCVRIKNWRSLSSSLSQFYLLIKKIALQTNGIKM